MFGKAAPDFAARSVAAALEAAGADRGHLARGGAAALAALLVARHLDHPVDLERVLEMALAETLAAGPQAVPDGLHPDTALHLRALLIELETAGTSEARLVRALRGLLDGRGYAGGDRFLAGLGRALAETGGLRAAG